MKNKSQSIGQRLKELRQSRDMTQNELAEKLFVSSKTISKWEKDGSVPETDTLIQIAELFKVTLDYLLTGKSGIDKTDAISKIELACREDNIALLKDIDIESFDSTGKDVRYYVRKYNAKNVRRYLIDYKAKKYVTDDRIPKRYHICALQKGITNEDDLTLIAWDGSYGKIATTCAKFEESGYHSFKVFREIDTYEKADKDYQYFYAKMMGKNGNRRMSFSIAMLDDMQSAVLHMSIWREKTYNQNKYVDGSLVPDYYPLTGLEVDAHAYIKPEAMKQFMDLLTSLDVKNWENNHYGAALYDFVFTLKDAHIDQDVRCHKFYVSPGLENYKKFTRGIEKLFFESLEPKFYKSFVNEFNSEYYPYYREGMELKQSEVIFKKIESEKEEIKNRKLNSDKPKD